MQKTAYEMRISDWSSDVCSSDLTEPIYVSFSVPEQNLTEIKRRQAEGQLKVEARVPGVEQPELGTVTFINNAVDSPTGTIQIKAARKSVVQGKSASVSEDIVGRRIIKKKKNITTGRQDVN